MPVLFSRSEAHAAVYSTTIRLCVNSLLVFEQIFVTIKP